MRSSSTCPGRYCAATTPTTGRRRTTNTTPSRGIATHPGGGGEDAGGTTVIDASSYDAPNHPSTVTHRRRAELGSGRRKSVDTIIRSLSSQPTGVLPQQTYSMVWELGFRRGVSRPKTFPINILRGARRHTSYRSLFPAKFTITKGPTTATNVGWGFNTEAGVRGSGVTPAFFLGHLYRASDTFCTSSFAFDTT